MGNFDVLDTALLAHGQDGDYWSDEGVVFAGRLSHLLLKQDFDVLRRTWPKRPAMWQKHCAEVLGFAPPHGAIDILIAMAGAPDLAVASAALASLREFDASLSDPGQQERIGIATRAYEAALKVPRHEGQASAATPSAAAPRTVPPQPARPRPAGSPR